MKLFGVSVGVPPLAMSQAGMSQALLSDAELLRYHRQINLKGWDLPGQEAVKSARVLIIGLGGLGCAAAQYLATAGVGQLTLLDGDKVELTNLARQVLHSDRRIGEYKVASAAVALAELNPYCHLVPLPEYADELNLPDLLSEQDLVLDCSDNLATRNLINLCCRGASVPLISGSAIRVEGQVSVFTWGEGEPCYGCLSRLFGEPDGSCVTNGVLAPLVGLVGSLQAMEALKLLTGLGEPLSGLLLIDGLSGQFQPLKLPRDPACRVCGGATRAA